MAQSDSNSNTGQSLRLAIAGLTHDHVTGLLRALPGRKDVNLVAIAEPNAQLAKKYISKYSLKPELIYPDLDKMLAEVKPQAVVIYTSTFEHLPVIEICAKHHIDVMMEKPMAVSNEEAEKIAEAGKKGNIHVLVNYATTWDPVYTLMRDLIEKNAIGDVRKIVSYKGHPGPKEIGCSAEFLGWLTDPKLNGGGALFDFGCYGANIASWYLKNEKPLSVSAVTRQTKPEIYKNVDDDATVVVTYPKVQLIIMASWSWPYGRDNIEVYGTKGSIENIDPKTAILHLNGKADQKINAEPVPAPNNDSLTYLAAVVKGEIKPDATPSLENNIIVTEILDAARQSAKSKTVIELK